MLSSTFIMRTNIFAIRCVRGQILKASMLHRRNITTSTTEIERKFPCTHSILQYCKSNAVSSKEISMSDVYFDNQFFGLTTKDMWLRQRNNKLELKSPMVSLSSINNNNQGSQFVGLDFYHESRDLTEIANILSNTADITVQVKEETKNMNDIISSLSNSGILPFGTFITKRTRYNLRLKLPDYIHTTGIGTTGSLTIPVSLNQRYINFFIDIDIVKYILPNQSIDSCNSTCSSSSSTGSSTSDDDEFTYTIGEIEFDFSTHQQDDSTTTSTTTTIDKGYNNTVMAYIFQIIGIQPTPVRGKVLEYLVRFRPQHYEALRQSGQLASKGL